jgi:gliding motility-associated protein GldC
MKKSEIKIEVSLDDKNTPSQIHWEADSPNGRERRESKAMLLSLFDNDTLDTFKIDIWTKDLQVAEMDRLMYYTLQSLTNTYFTATKNEELANHMRSFVRHFGEYTKIIEPSNDAE